MKDDLPKTLYHRVRQLWRAGFDTAAIARDVGVSEAGVYNRLADIRRDALAARDLPTGVYRYGDRFRAIVGNVSLGTYSTPERAADAVRQFKKKQGAA